MRREDAASPAARLDSAIGAAGRRPGGLPPASTGMRGAVAQAISSRRQPRAELFVIHGAQCRPDVRRPAGEDQAPCCDADGLGEMRSALRDQTPRLVDSATPRPMRYSTERGCTACGALQRDDFRLYNARCVSGPIEVAWDRDRGERVQPIQKALLGALHAAAAHNFGRAAVVWLITFWLRALTTDGGADDAELLAVLGSSLVEPLGGGRQHRGREVAKATPDGFATPLVSYTSHTTNFHPQLPGPGRGFIAMISTVPSSRSAGALASDPGGAGPPEGAPGKPRSRSAASARQTRWRPLQLMPAGVNILNVLLQAPMRLAGMIAHQLRFDAAARRSSAPSGDGGTPGRSARSTLASTQAYLLAHLPDAIVESSIAPYWARSRTRKMRWLLVQEGANPAALTPAESAAFVRQDIERWARLGCQLN